jgi:hypothetical protein
MIISENFFLLRDACVLPYDMVCIGITPNEFLASAAAVPSAVWLVEDHQNHMGDMQK